MKSSRKAGMLNVAASGVWKTQNGMDTVAIPPGKTQRGRGVQCKAAITRSLGKMAAASCTAQRTTIDIAVAVTSTSGTAWKTANAEKTRTVEKTGVSSQWVDGLNRVKCVGERLKTNDDFWKKTHGPAAYGKDTASLESIPSNSMQGSSHFQAIPRPAVPKKGIVTVSVTTCHVVPDGDTSFLSESKEKPFQKTGLTMTGALSATTNGSFPEARADPGKDEVQTGRARSDDDAAAIQESHQMAVAALNTFQQMAIDDGMAVQGSPDTNKETVSAGEARALKTEGCVYKPSDCVRRDVDISLRALEKRRQMHGVDSLQFCLAVIAAFDQIKNTFNIIDPRSQDYKFLVFQFGSSYVDCLHPALEILKDKASSQCVWEHHQDIISVAKCFFLYPNELTGKSDNRKLLVAIYKMAIKCEIHYLTFARRFSLAALVTDSCRIIKRLLNWTENKLKCSDIEPLGMEERKRFRYQMEELTKGLLANNGRDMNASLICTDGAIDEHIEKTEEALRNKTADALIVRLYNELLKLQLANLNEKRISMREMQGSKTIREGCLLLEQLCRMRDKCTTLIPKSNFVASAVAAVMSGVARRILEISLNGVVQLEKETLELIGDLMNKGLLSKKCMTAYVFCRELHASMGTAVQIREMTDHQCQAELDEINSLIDDNTGTSFLAAAEKLGRLLFFHGKEVQALYATYSLYEQYMAQLKNRLDDALFKPFMEKVDGCKEGLQDNFIMVNSSELRPEIVALSPFSFVLTDIKRRLKWAHSVCLAWYSDIERMAQIKSLTEEDVDRLLELKRVVPDLANTDVRKYLKEVFSNCLTLAPDDYAGIPVEKIMTLTEWAVELDYLHKPLPRPHQHITSE